MTHSACEQVNGHMSHDSESDFHEPIEKKRHIDVNNECDATSTRKSGKTAVLEPFIHQVTGRSHMLSLNNTTLCKSLLPRELLFYASIPEDLQPYTPELKGVLYAQLEESDTNENYKFTTTQLFLKSNHVEGNPTANPLVSDTESTAPLKSNSTETPSFAEYEKILFKGLERFKYDTTNGFTSHPWTVDKDTEALTESVGANPWAIRQHRQEINRMLSRDGAAPDRKPLQTPLDAEGKSLEDGQCIPGRFLRGYLMLEDMTSTFRHPNVIDFKLGRQIERDDCSQAKKDKHVQLAKNSSTGTLMLRVAGMQVYQIKSGHYLCRDKYYGRGLSSEGFKETLCQFLHNGSYAIIEVVPSIVKKLKALRDTLEKRKTFRFYASSLLIMYEGDEVVQGSVVKNSCQRNQHLHTTNTKENGSSRADRQVDVRMIDFAHSTYKGFNGDKTSHEGPDNDCLQAITNLIEMLQDIEKEANKLQQVPNE